MISIISNNLLFINIFINISISSIPVALIRFAHVKTHECAKSYWIFVNRAKKGQLIFVAWIREVYNVSWFYKFEDKHEGYTCVCKYLHVNKAYQRNLKPIWNAEFIFIAPNSELFFCQKLSFFKLSYFVFQLFHFASFLFLLWNSARSLNTCIWWAHLSFKLFCEIIIKFFVIRLAPLWAFISAPSRWFCWSVNRVGFREINWKFWIISIFFLKIKFLVEINIKRYVVI